MKNSLAGALSLFLTCSSFACDKLDFDISTTSAYSVYTKDPGNFIPKFEAVGCFCEYKDTVVLLKRNADTVEGNTWCIPGGKKEKHENHRDATIRETLEETGLDVNSEKLLYIGTHYIRLPHINFLFHMYRFRFEEQPEIKLALKEHHEYRWCTSDQALELLLITGEIESFVRYKQL